MQMIIKIIMWITMKIIMKRIQLSKYQTILNLHKKITMKQRLVDLSNFYSKTRKLVMSIINCEQYELPFVLCFLFFPQKEKRMRKYNHIFVSKMTSLFVVLLQIFIKSSLSYGIVKCIFLNVQDEKEYIDYYRNFNKRH